MKTKAAQRLAPAVVVGGILTAFAWGANGQEPAVSAAAPATTATSGGAASVTTSDGKVFTDAKVLKVEGNKAILSYSGGMTWVALDSLSDDARKSLGLPTRQEQTEFEEKVSCHPGIPRMRGVNMDAGKAYTEDDFRVLGTVWKANVVRWTMFDRSASFSEATSRDLDEYDRVLADDLDVLDKALVYCHRYGIKLVIYLDPPGGRYPPNADVAMLYDQRYQDHWVAVWEKIARKYKGNSAIWAYNPLSEPVETQPLPKGMTDCIGAQLRLAKAIRAIDPDMPIVVEVAPWDFAYPYSHLKPIPISNVIYSVHMYSPHPYTHQGLPGWEKYLNTAYPGKINGAMWDKEQLRKDLQAARDFQLAHNVGIYIGEFSVIRWAPGGCNYLRDLIDVFEEYGWDWTYHAYRSWDGWSVEQGSNPDDHQRIMTDREKLLLSWFAKNVQPARDVGTPAKP